MDNIYKKVLWNNKNYETTLLDVSIIMNDQVLIFLKRT